MPRKVCYKNDNNKWQCFVPTIAQKKAFKPKPKASEVTPDDTFVTTSNIDGAGKGLFAGRDFKKGEIVTKYGGRELTEEQVKKSASKYIAGPDKWGQYWDARSVSDPEEERGRWINHPPKGVKANVNTYNLQTKKQGLVIKTIRAVKAGEEFYYDYGPDYWK